MALSREQFNALISQGMTPEEIAEFDLRSRGSAAMRAMTPEQRRRRAGIAAAGAAEEAEAQRLETQAMRDLLATGGGAVAALLTPQGKIQAGRALLPILAQRAGFGALGGATSGGTTAAIAGEPVLPSVASGAGYGALIGPAAPPAFGLAAKGLSRVPLLPAIRATGDIAGGALKGVGTRLLGREGLEALQEGLTTAASRFRRAPSPTPVPARMATAAEMAPIVGRAEAAAFREGGMPAVEAVRATRKPMGSAIEEAYAAQRAAAPAQLPEELGSAATRVATETIEQPLTGYAKLQAMKPLRANASASSWKTHAAEVEQALDEARVPAAARKLWREKLGVVKPSARAPRAAEPKVAGKIEPGTEGPVATPAKGSAASRVPDAEEVLLAKPRPEGWDKPFSRHPSGYFSETKQAQVAIETMSQNHLNNAINKRSAELAKWGDAAAKRSPVKWNELQSLLKELKWRVEHGGVTVQGKMAPRGGG